MSEQIIENDTSDNKQESKKVPKKKPENKSKTEGRVRSKTFLKSENKDKPVETNKIKAEGIGQSRFSNLLSMFDKPKVESDNQNENKQIQQNQPGKLDLNKFGSFSKPSNGDSKDTNNIPQITTGLSIQQRMALLNQEKEKSKAKGSKMIDPILEQLGEKDENYEENENENGNDDDDDYNLALTDEENEKEDEDKNENENELKNEEILEENEVSKTKKVEDGLGDEENLEDL